MFLVNSVWSSSSPQIPSSSTAAATPPQSAGGYQSGNFHSDHFASSSSFSNSSPEVTYPSYLSGNMRELPMEDLEIAMKVVIVGNGSVGKSSMIQRFCRGIFTRDYKKTIGVDFLERILNVDDQPVRLMLWDTAGQEEFDAITRTYYRGANACVLACSITDKESFLALPKWKNKVCRECGDVPMVIVANKIDLQKESVVDSAELEAMARSLGIPKLIKTSVKDDLHVTTVFNYLAQSYMTSILSQVSGYDSHLDSHNQAYIDPSTMMMSMSMNEPIFSLGQQPNNNVKSKGLGLISASNNNKKGNNQISLMNGHNKSSSNNSKTGKSLFRNPIILKSSQPIVNGNGNGNQSNSSTPSPPPINNHNNHHTNHSTSGFGFFSKNKQNNNYKNHNSNNNNAYQQNLFHRNNRSNKYPGNNMLPPPVAIINGQMLSHHHHRSAYAPYLNGHGISGRDPRHWNDNIPFRLDLVKDRKRRKETTSCAIL